MVKVIYGGKGIGKTKFLLADVNEAVKGSKGDIVFIDTSSSLITNLRHEIRYVNISEFPLINLNDLFGFLCGMIAEDYDITTIYMAHLDKFVDSCNGYPAFFEKLKILVDKFNVDFIFSAHGEMSNLPAHVIIENNQ
jgi:hypothetical protein